jgi:hypothetical protein
VRPYPNVRDLERSHGITWNELADLEPGLPQLLREARQASLFCRQWSDVERLFAPIRAAVVEMVGFASSNCRHTVLGGLGAYQVAYWKLYDAVAGLLPSRNAGVRTGPEQPDAAAAEDMPGQSAATATAAA